MTKVFEFSEVGRLGKSRGINGGIKYVGEAEAFAFILQLGAIFIKMKDGSPVPFTIVKAEEKGDYILYFSDIETPEAAKELTGCQIMVERELFESDLKGQMQESQSENERLNGFLLKDKTSGYQNRVERIEQYPQQLMMVMESGHLVPLHEDFIEQIDREAKEIIMELPHGLFEE